MEKEKREVGMKVKSLSDRCEVREQESLTSSQRLDTEANITYMNSWKNNKIENHLKWLLKTDVRSQLDVRKYHHYIKDLFNVPYGFSS